MSTMRKSKTLEKWVRQIVDEATSDIRISLAQVQGKLDNGLTTRVRLIEKMQWWQIGIMITMVGALLGGMWVMLQRGSETARENQRILLEHVQGVKP
jgi:hypothetical protein